MKKILALFLALSLVLSFAACSSSEVVNDSTTVSTTEDATATVEATTSNTFIKSEYITIAFSYGERSGMYVGFVDENGLPDGTGTFESVNSEGVKWAYSGDWKHGHMDGHGITKWETGKTYCGEYVNDEASGYGMLFDGTGSILTGNFENGHLNGYGAVYVGADIVFWGNYNDGNAESGKVYLSDGSVVDASHINDNISYTYKTSEEAKPEKEEVSPTEPPKKSETTIGMKNALKTAKSYLKYSAFSYTGLIKQLEFEKYTHDEAVYAANNCGADWNEQAVKSAKSYLAYSSFSREGLIDQLEYEGFTYAQALYGVEAVGY